MAKEDLIPVNKRTRAEQKKITQKGGIASGKKRRENKAMRELVKIAAYSTGFKEFANNETIKKLFGEDNSDKTPMHIAIAKQIKAAMDGDLKALEFVRDMLGEKPAEKVDMSVNNPYAGLSTEDLKKLADEE